MIAQAAILAALSFVILIAFSALNPTVRMFYASLASEMLIWAVYTFLHTAPSMAARLALGLSEVFTKDRDLWAQVSTKFADELTRVLSGTQPVGGGAAGPAPFSVTDIGEQLGGKIITAIAPAGPLTPDSGRRNVETLLGLAVLLNMQGWWITLVGELATLGLFRSAGALPAAVEGALGINRLARLAWRTPIKKAIAEPLEELYNRQYRFKKLTIGEAHQAWHRGLVDDATFLDIAADAGYSPDRAAILLALARQTYSTAEVLDLDRFLALPDPLLEDLLREAGWDPARASTLLLLGRHRNLQKILDQVAAEARKLYRAGDITETQLRDFLRESRFPDDEVGLIITVENLGRKGEKQLTVAELLLAYRHDTLPAPEVRARLLRKGYSNDDVDVLLGNERRELSAGQIVDAVARGRITPAEGIRRLQAEGYTQPDAELIVSLRGRRLTEGQILDALNQRIINAQQARTDLAALGFDQDQVDILLAFMRRQLSPADIQLALARGVITEADARGRLLRLGFTQPDAEVIIELRRRLLKEGQILDAYLDGLITRQEALSDLQARGFSPDDALALVRVFEFHQDELARKRRAGQAPPAPAPAHPPAPSARRLRTGAPPPAP